MNQQPQHDVTVDISGWASRTPGLKVTIPGGAQVRFRPLDELTDGDLGKLFGALEQAIDLVRSATTAGDVTAALGAGQRGYDLYMTMMEAALGEDDFAVWRDAKVPLGVFTLLKQPLVNLYNESLRSINGAVAAAQVSVPQMPLQPASTVAPQAAPQPQVAPPSAQDLLASWQAQQQGQPAPGPFGVVPGEAPGQPSSTPTWAGTSGS